MKGSDVIALTEAHELRVYARYPVVLERGEGCRVWDDRGRCYLDLFGGLAVNVLGHCHPAVVAAVQEQTGRLLHASNLYYTKPAARLLALLCEHSFAERIFLCNSGAEANEAAIKLARRYGATAGGGRFEIITASGSFHGRTLAAVSATGQERFQRGFAPLVPGFRTVPYGDLGALEAAVRKETVAVMLEPIEGEGGVVVPDDGYLPAVRELCTRRGLLLILDEVQTGIGRTGRLFAYEHAGIVPDIMTLAKALGGGLPLGAMCTTDQLASCMGHGDHGSTFGGNPVACAAGAATLELVANEHFLENARRAGELLRGRLEEIAGEVAQVREVRGRGLMLGLELDRPARPVAEACLADGLIVNATAERVLRLLPPLTISAAEIEEAVAILGRNLRALGRGR